MVTKKKPGPKPVKENLRLKIRSITANDEEWAWVTEAADMVGVSAAAWVRRLIQKDMGKK